MVLFNNIWAYKRLLFHIYFNVVFRYYFDRKYGICIYCCWQLAFFHSGCSTCCRMYLTEISLSCIWPAAWLTVAIGISFMHGDACSQGSVSCVQWGVAVPVCWTITGIESFLSVSSFSLIIYRVMQPVFRRWQDHEIRWRKNKDVCCYPGFLARVYPPTYNPYDNAMNHGIYCGIDCGDFHTGIVSTSIFWFVLSKKVSMEQDYLLSRLIWWRF